MRIRAIDLADVLAYLVVLGVFIQFFPEVISESFVLALLTAVLLKVVLEAVVWVKNRLISGVRTEGATWRRVVSGATLLLVMPGSKFVVLGLVDLVFGDAVSLGGFFQVTGLIVVLILTRGTLRRLLERRASRAGQLHAD